MNPTFINQTFQNITAPQSLFKEVEIRHDLSAIKKRLLKEVNSLRSQLSLHEFLEDHSINQVLESVILGHSNLINPDDIVTHLRYKISNSDIHILTSSRPLLNLGMSKENLMESLEKCFLDILRELMQVTHKEKFESPKPFNIALKLGYDSSYAYLILAFSQTILSVESISTERGQCVISGLVNSPNYSLFIVLVKFEDYDIVISPNKMSYDFINRAYRIVFDQKYQMPLTMNFCPELQFYVKAGGNSVKYGQGSDFTYQDIMKMSSIITLAYSMPFKPVESPYVKPRMFLKHLVSQSNSRNIPNLQFSPSLSPTFNNSPMPRLSFNSRLSRGDLTAVNEETELRKSPNIARQKRVQWNKGHHNKENMNEENTTEKAYLGSGGSQKHLLSSNQQKATSREGLLFETLGKPTLEEQRYHSAESKLHFQTDIQPQNLKDNQASQVYLSGLFNPQIRVNQAHLLQNEHGLIQPTQTSQLPFVSTQKRSPVKRNINFETDSKYNGFQLNSNLNSASQDFKILVNAPQNTRNSRALAYPGDLHQMANDTQNKYNIVGKGGTSKVLSEAKPQDYASLLTNSTMFSSIGTTRQITVQPKTIMTPFGTFESVPNTADGKSFDPKEFTVDPKLFSEESLSELAIKQLEALEKKLIGNHTFNKVHQYTQLFKSNELQDVILKFKEGEDIMSHRIVLMQAPYFERIFQTAKTLPNEPIKVLMPDFLRVNSFRKVLEFIYNAEFAAEDLNSMTLIMAREILLTAYTLQLYHLMDIVLVKVIIPKMDKQMCIEFLKDSFEREDVKSRMTWKALQQYCLNFFALYSKQILKKYKQALEGVEPRLIYKIVSTTLMKCRDIHHMYELLALLVEHGFASNILDILEKVPLTRDKDKKFDSKCIPNIQEILKSLNPKSCYETNLIDCTSMLNQKSLVEEILDEQEVTSSEFLTANREVQNKNAFNHLEIQMKSNQQCPDPMLESNEWSEIKKIDPIYEMKLHFDSEPKKKSIISQMFDSDTRSWHLVVDIEEDQKLSVFLLERGLPTHSPFAGPFKNEFTSAKYLIQIKDGDHEYETVMFYTFANEHHYCIGHKRLISIPYLAKKDTLHIKVWMMELPVYSCAIQYLSTRFNDLLKDTFDDNANSKIINLKGEDKLYLGTKSNNLNQPVSKKGAKSEQKKIQEEFRRRKSINFLEASFFKEMEYSTEPTARTPRKNEDTSNKIDPLASHAVNPMLGQPNFRPQQTIRNVSHFEPTKTSQASIENVSRTGFRKSRKFEDLSPYDFYYLVSSDYLTIEHEKFLTYFMYKYTVEKKEEMINLICHGVRFSFIELSKLFNIARDLPAIRNNGVFASKLDFEVATRINSNKPFDRPRKFYSSEMYKDWNFKNDLLRWLIESDHHQGYRLKVEELRMIIKEKENKLKNQEEVIMQMNSKMAKLNFEISRHVEGDGVKKIKLNPPELPPMRQQQQQQQQQSSANIVTTFKNNCNVF